MTLNPEAPKEDEMPDVPPEAYEAANEAARERIPVDDELPIAEPTAARLDAAVHDAVDAAAPHIVRAERERSAAELAVARGHLERLREAIQPWVDEAAPPETLFGPWAHRYAKLAAALAESGGDPE